MSQSNLFNSELNDDDYFAVLRQLLYDDDAHLTDDIVFQSDDEHLTDDIVDYEDTEREQNYEADDQEDSA